MIKVAPGNKDAWALLALMQPAAPGAGSRLSSAAKEFLKESRFA